MSLRRRPIETATYIPRGGGGGGGDDFVTDTGFSLTSSGAIGFSDDIERKLSSMSSSAGATTASSSAAALATASSSSSSAGNAPKISCNRDVLSSIKPYSRFGTAAAAAAAAPPTMMTMEESFSDDELAMMLGASIPQTPAKQIKNLHDAARAAKKDLLLKKENEIIGREQEILIEDAYTAYATKGRYNSAQKLIAANLLLAQQQKEPEFEVPQRIFGVYRRMTTRIKDEKTKQVVVTLLLSLLSRSIPDLVPLFRGSIGYLPCCRLRQFASTRLMAGLACTFSSRSSAQLPRDAGCMRG